MSRTRSAKTDGHCVSWARCVGWRLSPENDEEEGYRGDRVKIIEDLMKDLKQNQINDNGKKKYCEAEFDIADDKKKGLVKGEADLETPIADARHQGGPGPD